MMVLNLYERIVLSYYYSIYRWFNYWRLQYKEWTLGNKHKFTPHPSALKNSIPTIHLDFTFVPLILELPIQIYLESMRLIRWLPILPIKMWKFLYTYSFLSSSLRLADLYNVHLFDRRLNITSLPLNRLYFVWYCSLSLPNETLIWFWIFICRLKMFTDQGVTPLSAVFCWFISTRTDIEFGLVWNQKIISI